ncbi:hybrid sensor histidine kinase/response regulator [Comamonas composti]|uniref:hybrid sensor histidine kinase/response regulator n=1 Tax=Comamonas composti TaxID=408558 RepID=UPI00146F9EF8|nr:PAS-domain containing protein [Comamonas composti]
MLIPRRLRPARSLLLLVTGLVLSMGLASHYVQQRSLRQESQAVRQQLDLYAQTLRQRIDRYRTLPLVLALDKELRDAVSRPQSPQEVQALNLKLERANGASESSTLTLIDRQGIALAASNWRDARSNVGEDYSFRPYVQQAFSLGQGYFYGIGLTTGVPGYFLSQAIADEQGRPLGIVVIKIALAELERAWPASGDIVFASDSHGVVFLASRNEWRYRLLQPLSQADRLELHATRQYANQKLTPLGYALTKTAPDGAAIIRSRNPAIAEPLLWQTLDIPGTDWSLNLLHSTRASVLAGRWAAAAAAAAWLALALLLLFIQQRRRVAAIRQRSRRELETVLKQHAQELRTAQDGIVQAAKQADTGLSRSLEHLPQGVVIIDADLKLVAWNSRYAELFRFPPELLNIGQPIEELFRHNARRGLLGRGPVEKAIERRLNHLRKGTPHLHESTKDDGTVLEIRGNPLPDGGFVTSYADITSYKNTARELRSLADALEKRIAERTRDLAQAKREAEQANRYKTRFVAAAVHDLLQPLNAARMFTSLLSSHVQDEAGRHVAESIENALAAQDAILGSLLDISRMESGQLEVHVSDFALGPLLQVIQHNFGILAQSHGLRLEYVSTRCVVRSDPALLRRILQNYLSNAIRYTRQGRIVLGCRRQGDQLRIEVHDQGPGIPESLQGEIFEEFRRLNEGHGDDRGAGLGLAIVERLGRLLGHPTGLRSRLGHGSVFWVCVPLGDASALSALQSAAPTPGHHGLAGDAPLQDSSVWYIEDDAQSRAAMQALLERWGCKTPLVDTPQNALAAARPGQAPQLVLLDVRLGRLHGPDVYARLSEIWGQSPPVILVTAENDSTLRRQAAERGWGFLAKPVRAPALRALMSQTLLRHREPQG